MNYKTPDRKTTREILSNWRNWARDLPPDSAEINYYTISPAFKGTMWAKPTPKSVRYDEKSAEMVEEVMRELYKWQPKAREWLILYWIYMPNNRILGEVLNLHEQTVWKKVSNAHEVFAKHWGLLFMQVDK